MYYCATGRETELSTHAETRWALGGTAVTSCAYLCHGQCNPIMQQSVIPTVGLSKKFIEIHLQLCELFCMLTQRDTNQKPRRR